MIRINREDRDKLERFGLLVCKGNNEKEPNLQVCNRDHKSRAKTYYVREDIDILTCLQHFDSERCNLQRITKDQFKQLIKAGLLNDGNVQYKGEMLDSSPLAYESDLGQFYIRKVSKLMLFLGIWKNSKNKNTRNTIQK